MTSRSPRPARPSAEPPLRELLLRIPGWRRTRRTSAPLELGGRTYRLSTVALRGRRRLLLCESRMGEPVPEYPERRALHRRVDASGAGHVIVFADALHATQVWTWRSREAEGPLAYHERSGGGAEEGAWHPERATGRAGGGEPERRRATSVGRLAGEAVLSRLLRGMGQRVPLRGGPPEDLPALRQAVQDLVEGSTGPAEVRGVWRRLLRFRVLDPACGAGGWLLGAMEALELAYEACLERMQVQVDETHRARSRRRPEHLRDFRAVLARATDPERGGLRRDFIREAILLLNLYGADPDPAAVDACGVRLVLRLGAGVDLPGGADRSWLVANLRAGDLRSGFGRWDEIEEALAARAADRARAEWVAEEAEAVERAESTAKDRWLWHGAGAEEVRAALAEARARRGLLAAQLDALRGGVGPGGPRPLHAWLEFHGVQRRGGFAVVRGGDDDARG